MHRCPRAYSPPHFQSSVDQDFYARPLLYIYVVRIRLQQQQQQPRVRHQKRENKRSRCRPSESVRQHQIRRHARERASVPFLPLALFFSLCLFNSYIYTDTHLSVARETCVRLPAAVRTGFPRIREGIAHTRTHIHPMNYI